MWSVADVFILGSEFLPTIDEGNMLVRATMPASISLPRAIDDLTQIEKSLREFPEVETVVAKIGRAELGGDPESVSNDEMYVRLKPKDQWTTAKTKDELVDAMRRRVEGFPASSSTFRRSSKLATTNSSRASMRRLPSRSLAKTRRRLTKVAEEIRDAMSHVRGAKDLAVEQVAGEEHLEIALDRDKLARYGLNVADVLEVAKIAIGGDEATDVLEGQRHFAIFVRLKEDYRNQVEKLNDILVAAPVGGPVPLGQLATFRLSSGDAVVSRENALRRVVVKCNVTGRDIGGFVHDAQAAGGNAGQDAARIFHYLGRAIRERTAGDAQTADCDTDFAAAGVRTDLCLLQFAAQHAHDHLQHPHRASGQHNVPADLGIPVERSGASWIHCGLWDRGAKRNGDGVLHQQASR